MDVRGLEAYIDIACPQVLVDGNMRESADIFRMGNSERQPILLIHGNSCSDWLYEAIELPGRSLGLYEEFKDRWNTLIGVLKGNGIRAVFFFDGYPTSKSELHIWFRRNCRKSRDILRVVDDEEDFSGLPNETMANFLKSDMETTEFLKHILRVKGCEIIQTIEGVVPDMMEFLAKKRDCIGLLARATHFIGFAADMTLFSVKHLNINTLATKIYCRRKLATHWGIDKRFFPLLATLCGNDITWEYNLHFFHQILLSCERNGVQNPNLFVMPLMPAMLYIPLVAGWIRQNSEILTLDPAGWAAQLSTFSGPSYAIKFMKYSLMHYLVPRKSNLVLPEENDVWSRKTREAEARYLYKGLNRSVYTVVKWLQYYRGFYYRDCLNGSDPHTVDFLRPLRSRMYGILLKDHPVQHYVVEERTKKMMPHELVLHPVASMRPIQHPGMLKLWKETTPVQKIMMLCWAVSSSLRPQILFMLPKELHIAFLSLFYISQNDYPVNITRADLETLLLVIVRLHGNSLQFLKAETCLEPPREKEVYIAHLFTQTWFEILAVQDACGSPYLNKDKVNSVFFDGKLFRVMYKHRVLKGVPAADLSLDNELYPVIFQALWPDQLHEAIVRAAIENDEGRPGPRNVDPEADMPYLETPSPSP